MRRLDLGFMSNTRWRLRVAVGVLGVLLVAWAGVNCIRVYCCGTTHLRLSGGEVCPLRTRMAQNICSEVHNAGIELESVTSTNSETICAAVDRGELDLGLVLGGFQPDSFKNVRQVAAFGVDPLHLLVRRDLLQNGAFTLDMLRGRRVSLGEKGTNGTRLAESLMCFAGLRTPNNGRAGDFQAEHIRDGDIRMMLDSIRAASPEGRASFLALLPDAVFTVDSLPAPMVDQLVRVANYQLVPLPFSDALHLDSRRDHGHDHDRLENSRLEAITIPAFTYGINPAVPAADCKTFGLRLLLVTNKNTSRHAIHRLLQALDNGIAERYHIKIDVADKKCEFPLHPGAEAFADGRKPLMMGELIEPLGNFMSVAGAGAAGALALWGFLRGLRAVHPDVHLRQIDRIERLLRGDEQEEGAPILPLDRIDYLEARLAAVKQAAIEDYSRHRLEKEDALIGILTLVADTRHLLMQRRRQLEYEEGCATVPPRRLADAA